MGLEKFNYAIDANIEKAERVFPDDYKIKDEEKDSYDELFDDKPKKSITERLAEIEIYEPSKELSENLKKIGEQMANEIASKEAYNYGSQLNEKYSVLDKEDGEKIEDWEEFREIEDDEQEYEEDLDELMDFISEVFDDR